MPRRLPLSAVLLVLVGCGMSGGGGSGGGSGATGGGTEATGGGSGATGGGSGATGGGSSAAGGGSSATGGGDARLYPLLPLAKAKKVVVGTGFACALTTTGSIRCWGYSGSQDPSGDLYSWATFGTFKYTTELNGPRVLEPVEVPGITDAVDIATNYRHVCALTAAKKMKCWGENREGKLGTGTTDGRVAPYELPLSNVKKMGVGTEFTCALLEDTSVKCWGSKLNGLPEVPVTLESDRYAPLEVPYAKGATDLFVGTEGACVSLSGDIRCWGYVTEGGGNAQEPLPWRMPIMTPSALMLSNFVSCGIFNGGARCWATASSGFPFLGTGADSFDTVPPTPQQVRGLTSGVTGISLGGAVANGKAYRWGKDVYLGNGNGSTLNTSLVPVEVQGLSNVVQLATSGSASDPNCVVLASGSVYCWGDNDQGQLGIGSRDFKDTPQKVLSFE